MRIQLHFISIQTQCCTLQHFTTSEEVAGKCKQHAIFHTTTGNYSKTFANFTFQLLETSSTTLQLVGDYRVTNWSLGLCECGLSSCCHNNHLQFVQVTLLFLANIWQSPPARWLQIGLKAIQDLWGSITGIIWILATLSTSLKYFEGIFNPI